jgi:hypothetical protein
VHVEGERGGGVALGDLLRDQAIALVVGPEPAVTLGDAQAEEPRFPEIGIVVERKGGLAVVSLRAGGEALPGEAAGDRDQLALARGGLEIQ